MQPSAREAYLETQVMTASPLKLRLMLIEGALRFVNQQRLYWDEGRAEEALESSIRAREIISELISSLSPERSPLAKQMLPIYGYIFRTLTEAQLEQNQAKLDDALRVLGEERQTWAEVCEKFADLAEAPPAPVEITAPHTVPSPVVAGPTQGASGGPPSFDSERFSSMSASPTVAPPLPLRSATAGRVPPLPMSAAAGRSVSFEA
jgi:flagellar protein FliS